MSPCQSMFHSRKSMETRAPKAPPTQGPSYLGALQSRTPPVNAGCTHPKLGTLGPESVRPWKRPDEGSRLAVPEVPLTIPPNTHVHVHTRKLMTFCWLHSSDPIQACVSHRLWVRHTCELVPGHHYASNNGSPQTLS